MTDIGNFNENFTLASSGLKDYAAAYYNLPEAELVERAVGAKEARLTAHGAVLNLSNVSRECQVSRKTVEGYVEVLEDLLLGFRLPVFARRAQRDLAVHPKFYFFDTGVFRSLRPGGPLDRPSEIDGAALEGLVASHAE